MDIFRLLFCTFHSAELTGMRVSVSPSLTTTMKEHENSWIVIVHRLQKMMLQENLKSDLLRTASEARDMVTLLKVTS